MSAAPPHPSPENVQPLSDNIFHLSPFLLLDQHTIYPIYYTAQVPMDLTQHQQQIPHDPSVSPPTSPLDQKHPETLDDSFSQPLDEWDGGDEEDNGPPWHNVSSYLSSLTITDPIA